MHYGVSWYPEQKTDAEFEHDLQLLIDSGFTVVRMGEFAWTLMEPESGQFNFTWLDKAVNRLGGAGIKSLICTPTACPPAWLVDLHPDLLYVDNRGVRRPFGGRREYCYTHPQYRVYSERIAGRLAEHFGSHPHVLGFQIDNEPAQEATGRCHCPLCQQEFRNWLRQRFKYIDKFNEAGGFIFWNQTYTSFDQVCLPVNSIEVSTKDHITAYFENPTLRLWAEEFASYQQVEYQNTQQRAMHAYTKKIITTNGTGLATNSINYYQSFADLDVYAFDYYPSLRHPISSVAYAFGRGIKSKPFWLLEFVSGGGHRLNGSGRSQAWPGALQQSVVHAAANGSELVAHFQFRTFPAGAEQLNYAIVDADGIPGRRYHECRDTARIMQDISPLIKNSKIENKIALLFDYRSLWALAIKPINHDFGYITLIEEIYTQLTSIGYGVDIIGIDNLDQAVNTYNILVAPAQIILSSAQQQKLEQYVESGGILAATYLASLKNENNIGYTSTLPAGLDHVFGLRVAEVDPVFAYSSEEFQLADKISPSALPAKGRTCSWCEVLDLHNALPLARFSGGFREGLPLAAENAYGKGKAFYLGTRLKNNVATAFWHHIAQAGQVSPQNILTEIPEGCQVVKRCHQDGSGLHFIFNFNERKISLQLNNSCTLLSQSMLDRTAESYEINRESIPAVINEQNMTKQGNDSLLMTLGPCQWVLLKQNC